MSKVLNFNEFNEYPVNEKKQDITIFKEQLKDLCALKDIVVKTFPEYKVFVTEIGVLVIGKNLSYTNERLSTKLGVEVDAVDFHRFTTGGEMIIIAYTKRTPEESKEMHDIERRSGEKWGWLRQ